MSAFNAMLAADAVGVFLQEFAEAVVYTPLNPTDANPVRTIQAVVWRDPPVGQKTAENWIAPRLVIRVGVAPACGVDPATGYPRGIDPSLLDTGGDTITANWRGASHTFRIRLPDAGRYARPGNDEMQDPALLTLELM